MNLHGYKGCDCCCRSMKSLPVYLSRYTKLLQHSRHAQILRRSCSENHFVQVFNPSSTRSLTFYEMRAILIPNTFMNIESGFILSDVGRSVSQSRMSFVPAYRNTVLWKIYGAGRRKAPSFIHLGAWWGERPASRTGRFVLGNTRQYLIEGWVVLRVRLDAL